MLKKVGITCGIDPGTCGTSLTVDWQDNRNSYGLELQQQFEQFQVRILKPKPFGWAGAKNPGGSPSLERFRSSGRHTSPTATATKLHTRTGTTGTVTAAAF